MRPQSPYPASPRFGSEADDNADYDERIFGQSSVELPRQGGLWGLWLRLTAPRTTPQTLVDPSLRERQRRAELTSAVAPFVILSGLLLAQQAAVDPITAAGLVAIWVSAILALVLNRAGAQGVAATLLVLGMDGAIEGTLITAHGGVGAAWLPTFDLFVVPLIAAGFLLSRRFLVLFAVFHVALILGDFYLLPHNPDLGPLIETWGVGVAFQRALILQIMGAALGYLAARSVDLAIARADRAEEIAAMEHQLVEQKRQLEYGIQQILATHVRVANGDFGARAPLTQDNVLFQIAASLNTLLNRLGRAAQSEYGMQRTLLEIQRLRDSLVAARSGRSPLWPAPSGTPVDMLLEVLAGTARNSALQQPNMAPNGGQPQFGTTSGPLMPPTSSRLGGGYGAPPGPYEQRRPEGNYPGQQPNPFSGPQGGGPYSPYPAHPGTPQTGAFAGPPGQPPTSAGLGAFGQPGASSGPFGRGGSSPVEPNSAPPPPQSPGAWEMQPPSAWEMPPLPDLPEDSGRG